MIGFSCPPMCIMPLSEAAEMVLPHFGHWEIVSEARHFIPDVERDIEILQQTTDLGISVHAPFSDINPAAFTESARKFAVSTLCEIIRVCHRLGIGPITVHPGVVGPIQRYGRENVFKLTRKSLEEIVAEVRELGVGIALENMPAMYATILHTAKEMEEMLEGLEMGMCFDIGHANISHQIDDLLAMEKRFINMHVHDNVGGPKDQHLAIGTGKIDFSVLGKLTYRGNHIIEVKSTDMAEAVTSKRYLERVLD
ncbi:MAG: sugar phosphate isomerase/epimerase [Candidatus Thermoplasmatota archaeon]|nr:sugar phosphate isomerase/epimerase [Candidatus Thermoplasmatota archaeon]MBU4071494.1 sugar phosphate isomerase/epimerase [Candidatus Thermoplasmatota archaeon]MBU4144092.1 sugar phosphate isomerase/epimerase [Candidatus Thermoplasmatota archaeon]MBU4590984.1 sugar phosphate isomerase/epimerase [Candidatus Thermoplasmatota archaeon]